MGFIVNFICFPVVQIFWQSYREIKGGKFLRHSVYTSAVKTWHKNMYTVSQKEMCPLFCSVLVKYEPISIKIGTHVLQDNSNKTIQKGFTSSKICASTTLGNLKWQIEPSTQYLPYMYILMNHRRAIKTTGSYCLENRRKYSKSHHLYVICSKCLPPAQTQARRCWRHDATRTFDEQPDSDCSLVFDASPNSSTSETLVRAGSGHFEHLCKDDVGYY